MWVSHTSPQEALSAYNVRQGSVKAPEGFFEGKPQATKSRDAAPQVLQPRVCPTLFLGDSFFQTAPQIFNSNFHSDTVAQDWPENLPAKYNWLKPILDPL